MEEPQATLSTVWSGRRLIARLQGAIDLFSAPDLGDRLRLEMEAADATQVDLRAVEFIDSSGIRMLFDLLRAADERGRRFTVRAPEAGPVRYVLRVCAFPEDRIVHGGGSSTR